MLRSGTSANLEDDVGSTHLSLISRYVTSIHVIKRKSLKMAMCA